MTPVGNGDEHRIIPFRGEYYKIAPERQFLVRNLIYPVPDPTFPFLGVHFTRMAKGGVEAGPNAVLALAREGYHHTQVNLGDLWKTASFRGFWSMAGKYWQTGFGELYRSLNKSAFVRALQKLVPEIRESDLVPGAPASVPRPSQPAARWWTTLLSKKAAMRFTSSTPRPPVRQHPWPSVKQSPSWRPKILP